MARVIPRRASRTIATSPQARRLGRTTGIDTTQIARIGTRLKKSSMQAHARCGRFAASCASGGSSDAPPCGQRLRRAAGVPRLGPVAAKSRRRCASREKPLFEAPPTERLGIGVRQVKRLVRRYREGGGGWSGHRAAVRSRFWRPPGRSREQSMGNRERDHPPRQQRAHTSHESPDNSCATAGAATAGSGPARWNRSWWRGTCSD